MAGKTGHVKSMVASCILWSIFLSPCAAQGVVCSNKATIVVNTTDASLVTDQNVPLQNPDKCVILEISPSDTTGLVAVEILEIFDNPPDVQVVAILYPSSQNRLYNNALISNTTPLFYIPAGDSPALELQIIASGSSADYGFRVRISLVNETDCKGNFQCQSNFVRYTACIRQESVCDGVTQCTEGNDEKNCEWCGESSYDLAVGQTATISNPGHNLAYVCSWQFHAPPLSRLLVRFTEYVVPPYVIFITSLEEITNFQGFAPSGDEELYIVNFLTANASAPRAQTVVDSTVHVYLLHAERDGNEFQNEFLRFQLEVSAFNEAVSCARGEFLCDTGIQCVSNNTRCDGLPDCDDHSDELGCNGCDSDKFSCVTNSVETCHTSSRLCDSSKHCDNFQDEYGCVPSCGDFKINLAPNTTHRLSSPYAPNGYPTNVVCAWLISSLPGTRLNIKTIQINLAYHATLTVGEGALVDQSRIIWRRQGGTAPLTTSSVGHEVWVTLEDVRTMWYVNNDGGYIPLKKPHFIIDMSVLDLAETRCSGENQVACNDGYQCINASDLCDGVIHCSDYSDELSCGHCGVTSLPCDVYSASSPCVDKSDICNGRADCTNYTDELVCSNICGSERHIYLEELPFDVTSPPNGLPPLIDCFWIFTTSPERRILFEVLNQAIGENDVAVIGDGTEPGNLEIARFQHFASPVSFLSNGSSMWLTLSATDLMTSYGSFLYQLSAYSDAGSCNETAFRCSSGVCIGNNLHCDGIDSCGDLSDEFGCPLCGNVSTFNTTDNQTHVLQKSFQQDQANFPFGISCLWRVVASPGHRIKIDVLDFFTSPINILQFGDGKEISTDYITASSFGTSSILSLTSKTNNMWIKLTSLVSFDDRFTMEIKQFEPVECEEGDIVCPSGLDCINQDEVCDGTPQCPLRGDEYGCGRCEVDEYRCPGKGSTCLRKGDICNAKPDCPDVSDEINCHPCGKSDLLLNNETAPSLPFLATYHPFCVWFITADTYTVVSFEFWRFELEETLDTLIIGNGHDPSDKSTMVVKLNGHLPSVRVITTGHEAWIRIDIHPNENRNRYIEGEISQKYIGSTCMEEEFTCTDQTVGIVCLDKNSTCDGEPICPDETDESFCSECGVENIRVYEESISLSSPGFPGVTPNSITCQWQIIPVLDQFLFARFTTFAVEVDFDKVYFSVERDSPELAILTGFDISWRTFAWKGNLWITMKTDRSTNSAGFNMLIYHENVTSELCTDDEFHCGDGFCVTRDSLCNGFRDCQNYQDENECSDVFCPGSYKCDTLTKTTSSSATRQPVTTTELATTTTTTGTNATISSNVSSYQGTGIYDGFFVSVVNKLGVGCIPISYVCDGEDNCKGLDDEIECDKKRCPGECECRYRGENLIVSCTNGWNDTTLSDVAVTTHTIHVSGSNVTSTREGAFKKLSYLRVLSLRNSKILSEIPPRTFDGLSNLLWLDLSNTSLTELKGLAMQELSSLRGITIFDVPLERIRKNAFAGLSKLETLILVRNFNGMPRLKVDEGAFDGLVDLSVLYVDDHRLCCFFPATIECKTLQPEPPLFVCSDLMPNFVLKISMWILGVSALIGNIFVVVWRCREDTDGRDSRIVQSLFVFNLAVSDSLMGVYMLIIAGADLHFGNRYFEVSSEWRASILCRVAGFLSIVASEASVFFLTVISIDRFICIVFPFSSRHIRAKSGRFIVCFIWIGTLIVGMVPTILALDPTSDAYGISDVCIGLPLMTKVTSYETRQQTIDAGGLTKIRVGIPSPVGYRASWFFSIALFLGVNLLCFLVILICYICIFASARSSMKQVRRHKNQDDELRMAFKMAAIVMTDFSCWTPVIIMGILSQSRVVEIPPETYAWVVVFILPINSSLNPYLYTISELCSQRKRPSSSMKKTFLSSNKQTTFGKASRNTPLRNLKPCSSLPDSGSV